MKVVVWLILIILAYAFVMFILITGARAEGVGRVPSCVIIRHLTRVAGFYSLTTERKYTPAQTRLARRCLESLAIPKGTNPLRFKLDF